MRSAWLLPALACAALGCGGASDAARHAATAPECPACPECPTPATVEPPPAIDVERLPWFVTKVIDGDTLVARLDDPERTERTETIRLLRIDTPERDEPGYGAAREALKELVRGGEIRLVHEEPRVERRGKYGRLLAYVFVDDLNVNLEMVRLGWSPFHTKYGRGRFAEQFEAAEAEARTAGVGLW
jgi:micrococcal nuclease